jgi:hypothetical protein
MREARRKSTQAKARVMSKATAVNEGMERGEEQEHTGEGEVVVVRK